MKQNRDQQHHYDYHEAQLYLQNSRHNTCDMPLHIQGRQDVEITRSEANKPRSNSPNIMPSQTDESFCSIVSRPGSTHYSSHDSGIDRNSGSFQSGTSLDN